jgi:hypothetical protein
MTKLSTINSFAKSDLGTVVDHGQVAGAVR